METKKSVDYLKDFLDRANYNVISIHGDKTQNKRQEAINSFSKGEVPILIATDVASRGLDFPNVAYVFNYDLPKNIDDYVHRIGRTGRCGNKGYAVSFVNEDSMPIVKDLYNLLKKLKQDIPEWFEALYNSSFTYNYTKPYKSNKFNNNFSNNSSNKFNNNYNKYNNNNNEDRDYSYKTGGGGYDNSRNNGNKFGNNSFKPYNNFEGNKDNNSKFKQFNANNFIKPNEVVFKKGENCPDINTSNKNNGFGDALFSGNRQYNR